MVVQGEYVVQDKEGSTESSLGLGGLGVAGLPSLSLVAKYSCFLCWTPSEKSSVEEEIKEKEEAIRQRSSEVQVSSHCLCMSVSMSLCSQCGGHQEKEEFICSEHQWHRRVYGHPLIFVICFIGLVLEQQLCMYSMFLFLLLLLFVCFF